MENILQMENISRKDFMIYLLLVRKRNRNRERDTQMAYLRVSRKQAAKWTLLFL